ncbi:centrosomal protein of 120 kDa-like isoform X3 [Liolophura sinensis]|uniref:centrosomal protein of 120 kDa-like isoform X3 n=1 Tax=Liolophura sinensis TaxID=3198878 RepID=UPI003158463B
MTMGEKDRFLVVVSVLEGRKFPKRPKHQVIVEARFDGELLASDPVDHVEAPQFTQELAWELDRKGLQQHRLQRTSIKVQCYAFDPATSLKEAIGYVVLDLRSAQAKQTNKWYPLLHSKYHKLKPELRLGLYLDEDKPGDEQPSFRAKEAPARPVMDESLVSVTGSDLKNLKPVLNEAEGFYQLGNPKRCSEQFVLSITIAYASNLSQLIPTTMPLPASTNGYFFYYSLFGNDVTNESFSDLLNPSFPAERASVRIRSSVDMLRSFFSSQPGVQFHLCCGDQSLGSCEVSLNPLLKKGSTEIYMKPVSIEGSFQLIPPNRLKQQMAPVASDHAPVLGVAIVLRKEDLTLPPGSPVKETPQTQMSKMTQSPEQRHSSPKQSPVSSPKEKTKAVRSPPRPQPRETDQYSEDKTEDDLSSLQGGLDKAEEAANAKEKKKIIEPTNKGGYPKAQPTGSGVSVTDSESTTQHHISIPPQSHHFSFSLDLRSVNNVQTTHPINIFLRYTYPFFGSAAPILTHPAVEARRGCEVLLPQSLCVFDFACTTPQLQETFLRVPLLVELWHRDRQLSKDVLLGAARLPLGSLLTAEKSRVMKDAGSSGWRQVHSDRVPVTSSDGKPSTVAEVTFVLALEDWGPINSEQIVLVNEDSESQSLGQEIQGKASSTAVNSSPQKPVTEPRASAEYQAALELEMWKETQEQLFEKQLKEKETLYMRALAEEWKRRDKERELLTKKRIDEYNALEQQLKKTIADQEKRERQLTANEQEVIRLRDDLHREHNRKLQEMKDASHRLKEDCDHQVEMERVKCRELEQLITRYKQELADAEKKYHNLEREMAVFREQQSNKPEVRLQSEINLLTLEKVELERKLDSITKSKIHYKQQWGRALKELARLKQKEQAAARAQLKRQQQELEHMRLRYLAAEEKEVMKGEKEELEHIKNELNRLRKLEEEKQAEPDVTGGGQVNGIKSFSLDGSIDEHITRLIEERDTLLKTGVYTSQDRIIAELDRQIREAIATKSGS